MELHIYINENLPRYMSETCPTCTIKGALYAFLKRKRILDPPPVGYTFWHNGLADKNVNKQAIAYGLSGV